MIFLVSCGNRSKILLKKADSVIEKKNHVMELSSPYTRFTEKAIIHSSVINGHKLQATGIHAEGDLVYISYNTQGNEVRGGFDIVSLSNNTQSLVASIVSEYSEYADIKKAGSNVFLVGQQFDENQGRNFAVMVIVDVSNPNTPIVKNSIKMDGYYATSIDIKGEEALVSVPNLGVVKIDISNLDQNLSVKEVIFSQGNVLYSKYFDDKIITLGGELTHELSWIRGRDPSTLQSISGMKQEAPARFVIKNNTVITNGGNTGLSIIDRLDESKHSFSYSGGLTGTGNGVAVGGCNKLYLAQGESGLMLFDITSHKTPIYEGNFDYENDSGSANNVFAHQSNGKNYVFVADGRSGTKVVEVEHMSCGETVPNEQSCSVENGMGLQYLNNGVFGECVATHCDSGYSLQGGLCVVNPTSCSVPNGTGTLSSVNDGKFSIKHKLVYDTGISYKYEVEIKNKTNKKIHDWSICFDFPHNINGGVISAIGDIHFGNPNHRIYSHINLYAGNKTTFKFLGHPGNIGQDRISNIRIYDSMSASCDDVPNYSSEPVCRVQSCNSGYHIEGGSCVSNTRVCNVEQGTGTQTWNGTSWGACSNVTCNNGAIIEVLSPDRNCTKCVIGLLDLFGLICI